MSGDVLKWCVPARTDRRLDRLRRRRHGRADALGSRHRQDEPGSPERQVDDASGPVPLHAGPVLHERSRECPACAARGPPERPGRILGHGGPVAHDDPVDIQVEQPPRAAPAGGTAPGPAARRRSGIRRSCRTRPRPRASGSWCRKTSCQPGNGRRGTVRNPASPGASSYRSTGASTSSSTRPIRSGTYTETSCRRASVPASRACQAERTATPATAPSGSIRSSTSGPSADRRGRRRSRSGSRGSRAGPPRGGGRSRSARRPTRRPPPAVRVAPFVHRYTPPVLYRTA